MRIYISVDMEGIAGIVQREQLIPGERLYEEARRLLTDEVNVVVESLVALGVQRIVVKDAHYAGLNLLMPDLHPAAEYCFGGLRAEQRFPALDETFDGAILLGYHAMAGTLGAIRDHTMTAAAWHSVTLNDVPVGEIALDALLFGRHQVPVLMVTGDDKACAEAQHLIPGVTTVQTKLGLGRHAGLLRAPRFVYAAYPEQVKQALHNNKTVAPLGKAFVPPYRLEIRYMGTELLDGQRFDNEQDVRVDGVTAVYTDDNLMRLLNRVL